MERDNELNDAINNLNDSEKNSGSRKKSLSVFIAMCIGGIIILAFIIGLIVSAATNKDEPEPVKESIIKMNFEVKNKYKNIYIVGYRYYELNAQNTKMIINDKEVPFTPKYNFTGPENYTVELRINKQMTNASGLFGLCTDIKELDVSQLDTSQITDMSFMFYGVKTTSLDISNFKMDKVLNTSGMFRQMTYLTSLDLSVFKNAKNNQDISDFVYLDYNLPYLDFTGFPSSKIRNMSHMFASCSKLTSINFDGFTIEAVEDMNRLFYGAKKLTYLDLSSFHPYQVRNFSKMFYGLSALTSVTFNDFKTSNAVNMSCMFYDCRNLTYVDLSNFIVDNVEGLDYMFYHCEGLTSLNLTTFKPVNAKTTRAMFYLNKNIKAIDFADFNAEKVEDMSEMFYANYNLTSLDISSFHAKAVTTMSSMFWSDKEIKYINLTNFKTDKVKYMNFTFAICYNLTSIDFSEFNTDNVIDINGLFANARAINHLDLSNFNTSLVTSMMYTFFATYSLDDLKLGKNFVTNKVTSMWNMFKEANALNELDICSFKVDACKSFEDMFLDVKEGLRIRILEETYNKIKADPKSQIPENPLFTCAESYEIEDNFEIDLSKFKRL